jgi:hypothetical protein
VPATATTAGRQPAPGALALRAFSYRSVESILRNGLDRQPLPPAPAAPFSHDNLRGPDYHRMEA